MMQIKFSPPSKDKPGYLMRVRKALEFGNLLTTGNASPQTLDSLVEFLADYVTEPSDKVEVNSILWDLTENQFLQLLEVVKGGNVETVPPESGAL